MLSVTITGRAHGPREVRDELTMNDFLREYLGMTGTKFGCGAAQYLSCAAAAGAWPDRAVLVYDRRLPLTHARPVQGALRSIHKELRSCSTSSRRLHPRSRSMRIAWIV
jgi:hypothetical protein